MLSLHCASALRGFIGVQTSIPEIVPASFVAWRWASLKYAGTVITSQERLSAQEREAKSRVIEKKPPKAAINLGTDVDAPWGEKIETSRKDNHQIA